MMQTDGDHLKVQLSEIGSIHDVVRIFDALDLTFTQQVASALPHKLLAYADGTPFTERPVRGHTTVAHPSTPDEVTPTMKVVGQNAHEDRFPYAIDISAIKTVADVVEILKVVDFRLSPDRAEQVDAKYLVRTDGTAMPKTAPKKAAKKKAAPKKA